MMFTLVGVIIQLLNLVNSAFLKNDRNYKWVSNNSAHMKNEHSIGTVHCKQENISRPFQSRPRPSLQKKSTLNGLLLT